MAAGRGPEHAVRRTGPRGGVLSFRGSQDLALAQSYWRLGDTVIMSVKPKPSS
jgi:hypothetical protein